MPVLLAVFLLGVVAGLRTMTPLAAIAWAAGLGWISLGGTWAAFVARPIVRYGVSLLALGELVVDKLPTTPSRKAPGPFAARVVSGTCCGASLGAAHGTLIAGAVVGALGAVAGTLGGYAARARLARAFGRDLPAALLEDVVAVVAALWIAGHVAA